MICEHFWCKVQIKSPFHTISSQSNFSVGSTLAAVHSLSDNEHFQPLSSRSHSQGPENSFLQMGQLCQITKLSLFFGLFSNFSDEIQHFFKITSCKWVNCVNFYKLSPFHCTYYLEELKQSFHRTYYLEAKLLKNRNCQYKFTAGSISSKVKQIELKSSIPK